MAQPVAWQRVFAWYEEAMRLFKHAPGPWLFLAMATLVGEFVTESIPGAGPVLGKLIVPLVGCGLLYAARAADRGEPLSARMAIDAFRAPPSAIAAIVVTALLPFAAEAAVAWWVAGANLLTSAAGTESELSLPVVAGIYAIGILASLPITFVPFHVLFERVAPGAALAASWHAFGLNTIPLLAYAAVSFVLLGFGLATMGIGLVLVLPLWAASSYAAWKDVFGVRAE